VKTLGLSGIKKEKMGRKGGSCNEKVCTRKRGPRGELISKGPSEGRKRGVPKEDEVELPVKGRMSKKALIIIMGRSSG